MHAYFVIDVIPPAAAAAKQNVPQTKGVAPKMAPFPVKVELISVNEYKGTVKVDYSAEATGSGMDPEVSPVTSNEFLDYDQDATDPKKLTVTVTGDPGQSFVLTAEATPAAGGSLYDSDSETFTLPS